MSARRRSAILAAAGVLVVAAIAVVLVLLSWDRSDDAVAQQAGASSAAPSLAAAPSTTTPAATTSGATPTPEIPSDFADRMQQLGIPLDPQAGWVVAQGICVRLGQPQYDEFRMSEGVERLFPWVPDEKAHEFVAMVAESECSP